MEMEYRYLGKSGLQVSALSLGSWVTFGNQIDEAVAEELMDIAYEAGINFFDNAEVYAHGKSEEIMGQILRKKGWKRSTWLVSSKVFWGGKFPNEKGLSRKHVVEACEAALKRLQVDYLDMYFCHRPDDKTPVAETVWTMHRLIMEGKVLYWGTSEWSAQQIMEAHLVAEKHHLIAPVMEQPQYNMFHRERFEKEYRRLYSEFGMGTTIWSPLASGVLTGKYNDGIPEGSRLTLEELQWLKERLLTPEKLDKVRKLKTIADRLGVKLSQLAIAWCLKNPNVSTVILGATKPEQLRENLQALEVYRNLTDDIMEEIEEVLQNKPEITIF